MNVNLQFKQYFIYLFINAATLPPSHLYYSSDKKKIDTFKYGHSEASSWATLLGVSVCGILSFSRRYIGAKIISE